MLQKCRVKNNPPSKMPESVEILESRYRKTQSNYGANKYIWKTKNSTSGTYG